MHGLGRNCSARFLALAASFSMPLPQLALAQSALPQGPSVVSGGVTIGAPSGNALAVTQSTSRAIVNWNSFSVGQGNTVTFNQPDASSAILNRVTGSTTSTIAGQISANGQVFLVNPNGIAITSTGAVKVGGGFVGSSLDIRDGDFMSGQLDFHGNGSSAAVSNAGRISTGAGGFVGLIGGTVSNSGTISVPLGRVGLGSGERATLDLNGDGFLQVAVPTDVSGEGALVSNSGRLSARGGRVELKAATVRQAIRDAVNVSGTISARSVSGRDGAVVLGGGAGGRVKVTGRVDAGGKQSAGNVAISGHSIAINDDAKVTARSKAGKGGDVTITGETVTIDAALIDVSGGAGGGRALIGGDYQGGGTLDRAKQTVIGADAVIRADAIDNGDGGTIVVWSDDLTTFEGTISARGGSGGGNGGLVEVSGKAVLDYRGIVDLRAPLGLSGTLLLDPYDITIVDAADTKHSSFTATGNDSIINVATLISQLALGNVIVTTGSGGSQDGNITVAAPIAWSSDHVLTLNAANAILINADITASGANGGLALIHGAGGFMLGSGASVTLSGANATFGVNGQAYTLIRHVNQLQAMNLDLAGRYALAIDIDASSTAAWNGGLGFAPVGNNATNSTVSRFTGIFDGLGHTITGLTVNRPTQDYGGLFGYSHGAAIHNVGLVSHVVSGRYYVGGLVGYNNSSSIANSYASGAVSGINRVGGLVGLNSSYSSITNSYAVGTVTGDYYVGGLVGYNNSSSIANSYASGEVSGGYYLGGLVGYTNSSSITNSYASGAVTGDYYVGGLVGYNDSDSSIADSYASGAVSGIDTVGGLVGYTNSSSITNSYASGAVTGTAYLGGLVGYNTNSSSITNSYASGTVSGSSTDTYFGGLVGLNTNNSSITNSYASGAVSGGYYLGGLVGYNDSYSSIANSYASGAVSGINTVGGLVGLNSNNSSITNSYASGAVSGGYYLGGLVGYNSYGGAVTASYWDTETTGRANGYGGNNSAFDAIGLTTAQARAQSSYGGFDFTNDWVMFDGTRPFLRSEWSTTITNAHQLQLMALDLTAHYTLAHDIDAGMTSGANAADMWSTRGFVPVGDHATNTMASRFTGIFDGLGHTITGLTVNRPTQDYGGLFGYSHGAAIHNVGLVSHAVSGRNYVGGLVGRNTNSSITNSYASGAVTGTAYLGGLVGYNNSSSITNSYASGTVSGGSTDTYFGGLVGLNSNHSSITNSYASGTVSGGYYLGGLVGINDNSSIANSYARGAVTGTAYLGGLVGYNSSGSSIANSYARGAVTGTAYLGGLVGYNYSGSNIANSYASGTVSGINTVGGLVGYNIGRVTVSFWDTDTTGRSNGFGLNVGTVSARGLTTAQMQDINKFAAIYAGWDFANIWIPPNQVGQGGSTTAYYPELYALSRAVVVQAGGTVIYGDRPVQPYGGYDPVTGQTLYALAHESVNPSAVLAAPTLITNATQSASGYDNVGNWNIAAAANDPAAVSNGGNYRIVVVPDTYTVTPRALLVSAVGENRVYDGGTSATVSLSDDRLGGDDLVLAYGTASFADKNAGVGKVVTVTGITLSGADAGNYSFNGTATASADITPRALLVSAVGENRVYDGGTSATVSLIGHPLGGDDLVLAYGAASFADKNAGVGKVVTVTGITLSGADAGNYSFNGTATASADIAPRALLVSAVGENRVYDGGTSATVSLSDDRLGGDDLVLAYGAASFADKNAGVGKVVTVTGITLSGADAGNYSFNGTATASADITPRALLVTALDASKTYDGVAFNGGNGVSYAGFVAGEDASVLSGTLIYGGTSQGAINVGSYTITASGLTSGNYDISYREEYLVVLARRRDYWLLRTAYCTEKSGRIRQLRKERDAFRQAGGGGP